MGLQPRVLAAFAKTHLHVVDRAAGGLAARVRAATSPGALEAIEKSSRVSWVDLAHHVELTERLFEEGGNVEAREVCRLTVLESFQQPFLWPLYSGALVTIRISFPKFVSWTPRAWPALFRAVGELSWLPGTEGSGVLRVDQPSPLIASSTAYVEGLAGAFSAFFAVAGLEGEVRASANDRRLEFELRWSAS